MHPKQVTLALASLLLCVATAANTATAAPGKDSKPAAENTSGGTQIIIRSKAEKNHRQNEEPVKPVNENSNRQSEAASTRGLDRAEERRPEHASQEHAGEEPEAPWYESIFGEQRRKSGGKPGEKDGESTWWWPFD